MWGSKRSWSLLVWEILSVGCCVTVSRPEPFGLGSLNGLKNKQTIIFKLILKIKEKKNLSNLGPVMYEKRGRNLIYYF